MLTFTRRPAMLGNSINTRAEKHGDEDVAALDIPINDVMLSAEELNALLQEPHAHNLLFNHGAKPIKPVFSQLKGFALKDKIEGCGVGLVLGMSTLINISDATLAKVRLEPKFGGLTALSATIQCACPTGEDLANLFDHLNQVIDFELRCDGYGDQQELPLHEGTEA